jgi:hypothetical protein
LSGFSFHENSKLRYTGRNDDLEVWALAHDLLEQAQQDVGVEAPLVRLVNLQVVTDIASLVLPAIKEVRVVGRVALALYIHSW